MDKFTKLRLDNYRKLRKELDVFMKNISYDLWKDTVESVRATYYDENPASLGCELGTKQFRVLASVLQEIELSESQMSPEQKQPTERVYLREGQTNILRLSDMTDPRTTHVAIHRVHGFKYFCLYDPDCRIPQEGIPFDQVQGTYWVTRSPAYGSCYHGSSLWQGGFDFIPISICFPSKEQDHV